MISPGDRPLVICRACVVFQALVLVQAEGLASLWRDIRGQLLLLALYACAMFSPCMSVAAASAGRCSAFCAGLFRLVLVMQPVPGWSGRVREAPLTLAIT
jgi:hypothetical protein